MRVPVNTVPCWSRSCAGRFTLANGLTLIVKPDRRAPTAVHMLWVRVGSMDEVDGTSGVAHVLEHMMFKGTPDVGAGRVLAPRGGAGRARERLHQRATTPAITSRSRRTGWKT
jgi:predicted Zn-dependent peptidase